MLDFYIANSLWINGLVLVYGLLVVLARRTFERSRRALVASLRSEYGRQLEQKNPAAVLRVLNRLPIPWERAVAGSAFPFITPPGSFRIYPRSPATLRRLLPLEALAEHLQTP